jgi:HK97 family phage prohead protease
MKSELRYTLAPELRAAGRKLSGTAIRYGSRSRFIPSISGYEMISPNAFTKSLEQAQAGERDLSLNASHDETFLLSSLALGGLDVRSDGLGLHFVSTVPKNDYGDALLDAVRSGDMAKCSFSFQPIRETRTADGCRLVQEGNLIHLTVCRSDLAAYESTSAEARSAGSIGYYEKVDGTPLPDSGRSLDYNDPDDRLLMDRQLHWDFLRLGGESRIYANVSEVPGYVPAQFKKQWMEVWNSAFKAAKKAGLSDKNAESKAFAEASGVIKKESVS